MQKQPLDYAGFGLGLRPKHYQDILKSVAHVDWFEIVSEDFMVDGGWPLYYLDEICERFPVAMHGVSLSIGSVDPLNMDYLARLKQLMTRAQPMWVSDHLCWTGVDGINTHDLLPLPQTEEAIKHLVARVKQVQDYLGRQILLENPSTYIAFKESTMPEWEFLSAIAEQADCLILLDVNNVYVNSFNHGFDPVLFINAIPVERVVQFHLSGHKNCGKHIIDTHDDDIIERVWELYALAAKRFPSAATLIERDDYIPPLAEMMPELDRARHIHAQVNPVVV